jgi:hypothetical protein
VIALELCATVLILIYTVMRAKLARSTARLLGRLVLFALASWIAEESAIRAYGFYQYSSAWSIFVGHVPLAVICIWAPVIHSAWDTSRCLLTERSAPMPTRAWLVPLVGGALVFADASLIEPISVQAKLWSWNEPGLFQVPIIGTLGWGLHAGLCMAAIELGRRLFGPSGPAHKRAAIPAQPTASLRAARDLRAQTLVATLALLLSPLGTHALLLGSWWGALRHLRGAIPPWPAVAAAWMLGLGLMVWAVRRQAKMRIPAPHMWTRVPAALLFLVLLVLYGLSVPALVAYACAFAPPYIALTRWPPYAPDRPPTGPHGRR